MASLQAPRSIDKLEPLLAKVAIPQEKFDEAFPRPRNLFSFVEIEGDATPQNTAALQSALEGFPDLALDTEAGWVEERASGLDMVLNLFYVLLALSVIVSLFGMVNTLILSVFERTRELGMLRAVGMTRRQVRRMVRQESVITALIGAAVGLPLGHVPRGARLERAGGRGDRLPGAVGPARGVHDRRPDRRGARRDRAGPARGEAQRAEGAAVRVTPTRALTSGTEPLRIGRVDLGRHA